MVRECCFAAALLLLAACGRAEVHGPFVESQAPPGLASQFLAPEGWGWGLVQVGDDPAQRYGVASPAVVPRAQALIVPGYGESAEVWFETVRDLNARGATVWVLDRAGQAGSGRFVAPHDLGHVPSFDPDVRALLWLTRQVIRPQADQRFVVLAHADGAVVALLAMEDGLRADGLILCAPRFAEAIPDRGGTSRLVDVLFPDDSPPLGWRPWRRTEAARGDPGPVRPHLAAAWQTANPDLRMSAPSRGWSRAFALASQAGLERANGMPTQTLQLGAVTGPDPCPRLPACRKAPIAAGESAPHLSADSLRGPWIAAIAAFLLDGTEAAEAMPSS